MAFWGQPALILLASLSFSQELIAPETPGLMGLIYVGIEQQQGRLLAGAEDANRKQNSPEGGGMNALGVPEGGLGGCCCSPGSALSSSRAGHLIIALILSVLGGNTP